MKPPPPNPSASGIESPYLDREVLGTGNAELGHEVSDAIERSPFVRMEQIVAKPAPRQTEEVALRPHIVVVNANDKPLSGADYAFHQDGRLSQKGTLAASGFAFFGEIDFKKPFVFEVLDRVCAIRVGAYLDPAEAKIQYGGTSFDWTLVRDDKKPDKNFWPYYQREMDFARDLEAHEVTQGRRVERFLQHEHITRRPIQIVKPFLSKLSQVRIRATPVETRVRTIRPVHGSPACGDLVRDRNALHGARRIQGGGRPNAGLSSFVDHPRRRSLLFRRGDRRAADRNDLRLQRSNSHHCRVSARFPTERRISRRRSSAHG